ncbi:hypothetical protein EV659_102247 [Rhodothalassium salexigens DSM 2132]|uniref:Uncharacterized protein n=1 Tax=Rhodothalassium salexigens DSM 2132 TaxID=1188247 RepID=A0A4R2PPX8_RHOSA|nr:hypothetical protein [Rhodothalassium salexigens DSM 2132]TCP37839.1 hypothetical protein EV659_102247 [Rhodothalassium salexigens DSM 2132]
MGLREVTYPGGTGARRVVRLGTDRGYWRWRLMVLDMTCSTAGR